MWESLKPEWNGDRIIWLESCIKHESNGIKETFGWILLKTVSQIESSKLSQIQSNTLCQIESEKPLLITVENIESNWVITVEYFETAVINDEACSVRSSATTGYLLTRWYACGDSNGGRDSMTVNVTVYISYWDM